MAFNLWKFLCKIALNTKFNWKKYILAKVKDHDKRPSFNNENIKLKAGESITLKDKNGVFNEFSEASNYKAEGIKVSKSGDKLTITAEAVDKKTTSSLTYQKYADEFTEKNIPSFVYHQKNLQTLGEFKLSDPIPMKVNVEVEPEPPSIGTKASFVELDKENPNITTIKDIVKYKDLVAKKEYILKGKLMNKNTGKPVTVDGKEVTSEKKFTTESIDGKVSLDFTFDQSKINTDTVVVFEKIFTENESGELEEIANHEDIKDIDQTVEIPKAKTEASFVELDKEEPNMTTLVDIVKYENLIPGKEYTVEGTLMNKETGEPIIIDDKEVTGKTTFVPEKSKGSVEVEFVFDKSKLETKTVVVFEDIYKGDALWAVHHDINDKEQTVEIPEVGTKASFVELDKENPNMTTLIDVVEYKDLVVGEEYEVTGTLMDKETGEPIIIDGKEITGKTVFTAKEKDGKVEVEFVFDQSKLETDTVVVFEDLYNGDRLIAVHHDINDKEQTVEIPGVGTTASFVKIEKDNPDISTLVDIVKYENLIPGKEYTVEGILMDKETGEPIEIEVEKATEESTDENTEETENAEVAEEVSEDTVEETKEVETTYITGSTTFTPEEPNGEVEVAFTFDKSKLKTDTVVVFEDLYNGERLIAVHHDINDEEQTVEIPEIGTTASFVGLDEKEPNMTTLVDIVAYEGLIKGKEYTVDGVLMNKETGEPIVIDGKEVTGSTTFTAEDTKGTVEVSFTFDQSKLETDTVVVFEDLYDGDNLFAVHHDINDEEQTVEIPEIATEASFSERDAENPNYVTIVDVVKYENLIPGKEYTVSGKLMDKYKNEPIKIDGKEITGSTTFTPEEPNGEVEVEFKFDQTRLKTDSVVVFEDLRDDKNLVAVHHDIEDIAQTVDVIDVSVVKVDSDNGKKLKGAEFTMYDLDGNVIDVQKTNSKGIASFNILDGEEVVIEETKAPTKYEINESQSTREIEAQGKDISFEVENERIKDPETGKPVPFNPITGKPLPNTATDIYNIALIGLGLFVLGSISYYFYKKKKKITN